MIIQCDSCRKKYNYPEEKFGDADIKRIKCPGCQAIFEIRNPNRRAAETGKVERRILQDSGKRLPQMLMLPEGARCSIALIKGKEEGKVYRIDKPRLVIGRAVGDILVDDPELSRQHAAVEFYGEKVILRDLGSTNGTFAGDKKVEDYVEISNQSEFRVGNTTLMLIVNYAS